MCTVASETTQDDPDQGLTSLAANPDGCFPGLLRPVGDAYFRIKVEDSINDLRDHLSRPAPCQ
jgi:hypothetical protein